MRTVGPDTGAGDRPSQPDGSPSDGVLPDAAADMPGGDDAPADGPSGMDADIDSGGDDAGADAGMADGGSGPGPCAEGCPMNVQPQALLLWLSADVGVTCDSTASPPRVSQWLDRARSDHAIKPAAGKLGPQCGGGAHVMSATPIPFFDRPGTDADDGVLVLDLRPMIGSDYTVFVVERRLSANEGYFLGTGINGSATTCGFNAANTSMAYHFGYFSSTSLLAGAYGVDVEMLTYNCTDVTASVPAFSSLNPRTALDVERFSSQSGRALWIGTTSKKTNTDKQPILSLPDGGYLGRAFQTLGTRGSRYVGDIAEVVIYTMALSDDERTAVSTYLMNRWPVTP